MRASSATARRGAATTGRLHAERATALHVSKGPASDSSTDVGLELEPWSDTIGVAALVVVLGILVFVIGVLS